MTYVDPVYLDNFLRDARPDWRFDLRRDPHLPQEYLGLKNGLAGLEAAIEHLRWSVWHESIYQLLHEISRLGIDSPIERMLYVAHARQSGSRFRLLPQYPVGEYRLDFLALFHAPAYGPFPDLRLQAAIECDGHDFHERTKEQAEHDRRRDRYIQAEGLPVLRFTGAEINRDSRACVEQIEMHFDKEVARRRGPSII